MSTPDVAPDLLDAVLVAYARWITVRNREARSDPRGCVHVADDRNDPSAEVAWLAIARRRASA